MKPIHIVGAGFSGLTLAYCLSEFKIPVEIFELESEVGGLLGTLKTPNGLVERAANALLADAELEKLFFQLQVPFAVRKPERKKRYIYWNKPRRWPLSLWTTLKLLKLPVLSWFGSKWHHPRPRETIREWSHRVVDAQFEQRLLTPALQGIYAGDVSRLSASLILSRLFAKVRPARGIYRGSVSPALGMGQLTERLREVLRQRGVPFHFQVQPKLAVPLAQPTVLCTSAWAAARLTEESHPEATEVLARCESLPLITITAFYPRHARDLQGFGCLFPPGQGFTALGALLNDTIFEGRSLVRSETWIFGGAMNRAVTELDDANLRRTLAQDRTRLTGVTVEPLDMVITRWPQAIPHYTVEWEAELQTFNVPRPLFLHGNYLGQLGLTQIFARSRALALQIKELYGH